MVGDVPRLRDGRKKVLVRLRDQLESPQPPMKRVARRIKRETDWNLGEVIAFRLKSEKWTLMRVIGYHADHGERSAICELLDWIGIEIPAQSAIEQLIVRQGNKKHRVTQFLFQAPRKTADKARIKRTGMTALPTQKPGGYTRAGVAACGSASEDLLRHRLTVFTNHAVCCRLRYRSATFRASIGRCAKGRNRNAGRPPMTTRLRR